MVPTDDVSGSGIVDKWVRGVGGVRGARRSFRKVEVSSDVEGVKKRAQLSEGKALPLRTSRFYGMAIKTYYSSTKKYAKNML